MVICLNTGILHVKGQPEFTYISQKLLSNNTLNSANLSTRHCGGQNNRLFILKFPVPRI